MWRRLSPARFNAFCLLFAELWLAVTIPLGIVLRPTIHDFGQFYLGGGIVREGAWHALYPVPTRGSRDNAGLRTHSFAKPGWLALGRAKGVSDYTHFILPPPTAILFVPFSFLTYRQAFWVWMFILTASTAGICRLSMRLTRLAFGRPTSAEGAVALLIALSPMTARAIRIGNVSPLIGFLFGLLILSLIRNRPFRGGFALFAGTLLKYATLVVLPLVLSMRRWKTALSAALLFSVTTAVTLAFSGTQPFLEFYHGIVPTLSRPSAFPGNQTAAGFLARLFGRPLPFRVASLLDIARMMSLAAILALLPWVRREQWKIARNVIAGAVALISWLLIFSPIAWEHWPIFLAPFWGWLLREAGGSAGIRLAPILALVLIYFPAGILQVPGFMTYPIVFREPYNSTQLCGMLLVFWVSVRRLLLARMSREPASLEEIPEPRPLRGNEHGAAA